SPSRHRTRPSPSSRALRSSTHKGERPEARRPRARSSGRQEATFHGEYGVAAFGKVLVANRGEIAIRVFRTLRELGIGTVAVYSDADRAAAHVAYGDEAYLIGGGAAAESYLNQDAILEAARRATADAVHPGYGFLAENASFARACEDAGIVWIGPPPDAIEAMGSKIEARDRMRAAGVPIVPGTTESLESADRLVALGDELGWPLAIKASAGGGGKGLKVVGSPDEAARAFESAQRGNARRTPDTRRRVVLPRDEHAHPGRAHRHRAGHRSGPRSRADPDRGRESDVDSTGGRPLQRPCDRVPHQRRGRRQLVPARP